MGVFGYGYIKESIIDTYQDSDFTPNFIKSFRESIFNDIDISEEDIKLLSENSELILEAGNAIKNKSDLESNINKVSKDMASDIKKNGINKESLSDIMDKFWKKATIVLDSTVVEDITKKNKSFTKEKVNKAIVLVVTTIIVSTICEKVLAIVLTPRISKIVTTSFIGPIIEENAKQISIKDGIQKEFFVVFNIVEYSLYLSKANIYGVSALDMAIGRLKTVMFHLSTTFIHWIANNTKLHKELGIEDLEKVEKKKRMAFIGHLVSVLMHIVWNTTAVAAMIKKGII